MGLTQEEVAFLLGTKSAAEISRYEHARQIPQLRTLLEYEYLFQTPIRKLYDGVSVGVEHGLRKRLRKLIAKLLPQSDDPTISRKIEVLKSCLNRRTAGSGAV